jgi:ATP-dependent exoDNAse (exonuclease V) beta subunit
MNKALTVYKASAGSGKTFTLAVEYIRLLIENPQSYRNILAVTFTNKATEEMKLRILSQLYGIANGLDDSEDYLNMVMKTSQFSKEQIKQRAQEALTLLIHNYNYFNVETIDAFFQSVLRNLARELDLTANMKLVLNDKQTEEQAVDEMIDELVPTNPVLNWILEYIRQNMDEDRSWNIIGQIKSFGLNTLKDFYKNHQEELNNTLDQKDFFKHFSTAMRNIKKSAEEKLQAYAKQFFDALENSGHDVSCLSNGKSGVASYFVKLKAGKYTTADVLSKRVQAGIEAPENWVKKSQAHPGDEIYDFVESTLLPILRDAEAHRPALVRDYLSADITIKHLSQLRLLQSISKKIAEKNAINGHFMLSNTQQLLNSLIDESDSPFIYEKIGSRLDHIMIDEFQDTSTVQWDNFKVLLEDTMSHGTNMSNDKEESENVRNLIVGDVKQSIYRWRSGDWRLLNNIEREFPPYSVTLETLKTNYRSQRRVISFNNAFFKEAIKIEAAKINELKSVDTDEMVRAYSDVEQAIPEKREEKGYVEINLLSSDDYDDSTLSRVKETIQQLISLGEKTQNICILVRNRKSIQEIGDYLMRQLPDVPLVSDEAFKLDASMAVNTIVYAMHLLTTDDLIAKAYLVKTWLKVNGKGNRFITFEDFNSVLPQEYIAGKEELLRMPMVDMAERIYEIFHLERLTDQSAYVCAFYDELNNFLQDNIPDIDTFWKQWNEDIHEKTIMSSEPNGVRLMTIHKSKGLEFNSVIMPYCDWALEKTRDNVIWCEPQVSPYNELPLVPVDFSSKLSETIYSENYEQEHMQNIVDNLNLLYVAFTRAGSNLYVFAKKNAKENDRSAIINQVTDSIAQLLNAEIDEIDNAIIMRYGEPLIIEKSKKESKNVFMQPVKSEKLDIASFHNPAHFKQSNDSKDFISKEIEDDEQKERKSYIRLGCVLHKLFSTINSVDDLPAALLSLENEGVLYDENITPQSLQNMLNKRFDNPQVKDWFSNRWTLFNECSILRYDSMLGEVVERRPDRVMSDGKKMIVVDFKFGKPNEKYHDQVHEYMQLLADMGHKNIEGYLWYVYSNKIVKV